MNQVTTIYKKVQPKEFRISQRTFFIIYANNSPLTHHRPKPYLLSLTTLLGRTAGQWRSFQHTHASYKVFKSSQNRRKSAENAHICDRCVTRIAAQFWCIFLAIKLKLSGERKMQ